MELRYETRDAKGNDFVKMVKIKEYPILDVDFVCPICKKEHTKGIDIKKIVSSNFTDWEFVGNYICEPCSRLFSLYFYSYIVDDNGIRLLNLRQLKNELIKEQPTPFRFIITQSQKKHLFYRSEVNYSNKRFAVNLETETIYTTHEKMKELFVFVESLMALGASKKALADGEIPFSVIQKTGHKALFYLQNALKNREIQIVLHAGQKPDISEEEALCCLDSILTVSCTQEQP